MNTRTFKLSNFITLLLLCGFFVVLKNCFSLADITLMNCYNAVVLKILKLLMVIKYTV